MLPRASARAGFGGAIPPRAGGAAFLGGQRPLAGGPGSAARFPARWPLPRSTPPVSPHRRGARRCLRGRGGEAERSPKFRLYRPAQHPAVRRMIWAPPRSLSMGSGGGGQEEQRITPGTRASEDPLTDRRIHRLSS